MKLKRLPEDFCVEEVTTVEPSNGPHAFYRLRKTGIGTPEAVQAILRAWNLRRDQIEYGGLKDRHAVTSQFLTIRGGPKRNLIERSLQLEYLGQAARPFGPQFIDHNRFHIVLRDIPTDAIPAYTSRLEQFGQSGVVNYFDDQRFGSLGVSGQFIAHAWCLVDYERALYLAMAEANVHDRPREREQKETLRLHWGRWVECKERLDRSHRRSIVTYLVDHPQDFKRAIALIRSDLRGIYVAAFQSYLWNRWVSDWLGDWLRPDQQQMLESRCGPLVIPRSLDDDQKAVLSELQMPLPSARQRDWDTERKAYLDRILAQLNMDVHQLRLKYPRDTFFAKGNRSVWLGAEQFTYQIEVDDLRPTHRKIILDFRLPPGSYATMVVKWLRQGTDRSLEQ